ncbi:DUF1977-domain-containing protein [Metschnikowia bicuspidata var. bicuspidata NRRL YB-4993]|uniref:DUF1977-domain-containing protein n=1 Tax=Metschnikowia bicuspidata var. bicuspidata NRRL YB-4993 TaxID=869754 RepID=A0A1A0H1P2_9ASCO|nr:DUF1977-domain-containing protein [Metschnikowia bicuspidata var. bicuspidata NRRL YB-4993]OBA17949.1 DUF1977-domain-containing protein [Metschnikowia bicuspidata var. bicuspidata NRRL YB-4993]
MSSHSAEQEKVVLRVLSCKPHQYYEILECEKSASDSTIKKSYRKLAIKLHPDKNSHPRASEAFKYLNKAWGVLSDPSKKRIFDQTGSDPDSRFAGSSSPGAGATSGFSRGFGNAGGAGAQGFEDDIFNMFFGGGAAPGHTTFTFGGNNGFTFQSFGNGFDPFAGNFAQQQRQRQSQRQSQQNRAEPTSWETLRQLAPVLLVLLATLLSSLFSGDSAPEYSFTKSSKFPVRRNTPTFEIPYFVSESFVKDKNGRALHNFDTKVENTYILDKRARCRREQTRRREMIQDAQGWFFTDEKRMNQARNMPMPACSELKGMGII